MDRGEFAKLGISDSTIRSGNLDGRSAASGTSPLARAPPAAIEVHGDETKIRSVLECLGLGGTQPETAQPILPPVAAAQFGAADIEEWQQVSCPEFRLLACRK